MAICRLNALLSIVRELTVHRNNDSANLIASRYRESLFFQQLKKRGKKPPLRLALLKLVLGLGLCQPVQPMRDLR